MRITPPAAAARRTRAKAVVLGALMGVWLWCIIGLFNLLPKALGDWEGLVLLSAVSAALSATHFRILVVAALIGWTALVGVVVLTPLSRVISTHWIRTDPPIDRPIGGVIVLSGGTTADTTIDDEAVDRLIAGMELARRQPPAVLVTTLGETHLPSGPITSEADQSRIVHLLGGNVEWLQTAMAHTTHDEALRSAELLRGRGIHRIAVVTSPMHTRRACATFEMAGFEVVCVPAHLRSTAPFALAGPGDRIAAFGAWVYELLGTLEYRTRGWIS